MEQDKVASDAGGWTEEDDARHEATYKAFVKGVVLFTVHVVVILLLLAYLLL
jgi:hypothetical protein